MNVEARNRNNRNLGRVEKRVTAGLQHVLSSLPYPAQG